MGKCPEYCMLCVARDVGSNDWDRFSFAHKAMYLFSIALYQRRLGVYHKEEPTHE